MESWRYRNGCDCLRCRNTRRKDSIRLRMTGVDPRGVEIMSIFWNLEGLVEQMVLDGRPFRQEFLVEDPGGRVVVEMAFPDEDLAT